MSTALHIARDVLDHEIVDANGVPCGTVDDLEIEGRAGGTLRVVALLCGPGAMQHSLGGPLGHLVRRVAGSKIIRIPWSDVASVRERVVLRVEAKTLGLNAIERQLGRMFERLLGG